MEPVLVVLAAGMSSRYGSLKQIEGLGPNGETILDYSIYDAIACGYGKIVFIIKKDFENSFREIFDGKLKGKIEIEYVFQELEMYTNGFNIPLEREKPWGTAHAVLCVEKVVDQPFAVINADDFYGRDAFQRAANFLRNDCEENLYSIIGYELMNTLSDHGFVNRGVCSVDRQQYLIYIKERLKMKMIEGEIIADDGIEPKSIFKDAKVSMNFWCFHHDIFDKLKFYFTNFLKTELTNLGAEFFIPLVAEKAIFEGSKIRIIPTSAQWFGVTYKEDAPEVKRKLIELVTRGEYPNNLF